MLRLSSLAALMGTALLVATAQPYGAAAQSSGYVTYDVWIQNPDGSRSVSRHRMPSDLAQQVQRLYRNMYEDVILPPPVGAGPDLEAFSRLMEALARPAPRPAPISRWLDQIWESEPGAPLPELRLEPVWGTFPGSPLHAGYRAGDGDAGGDDGGGGGGGGED